jgi:error-prone DNA polymerase
MLRRALGSDLDAGILEQLRQPFIEGALRKGVAHAVADRVFDMLLAFGGYAFPKSHAAAFAVLVYQSAWLKRYHPAAFYAGLLNNQPMGFWSPAVIVNDARRHGVDVLPVDINRSSVRCTVEKNQLRLGLCNVTGIGGEGAERIDRARAGGAFADLNDFCQRTALPRRLVENLIQVGALDGWGLPRRKLLWELGTLHYPARELDLRYADGAVDLPALTRAEKLDAEYALLGLSAGDHPVALYRPQLAARGVLNSEELKTAKAGSVVRVAGLRVIFQSPPTAKGFRFITLEDELGMMSVIIRTEPTRAARLATADRRG